MLIYRSLRSMLLDYTPTSLKSTHAPKVVAMNATLNDMANTRLSFWISKAPSSDESKVPLYSEMNPE